MDTTTRHYLRSAATDGNTLHALLAIAHLLDTLNHTLATLATTLTPPNPIPDNYGTLIERRTR